MKNFSPRAKEVLFTLAQDEARKIGSKQLYPEHVLLAILKSKNGVAFSAIKRCGINYLDFKRALEKFFTDTVLEPNLDEIPRSSRFEHMLDLAGKEADQLNNDYIGTEHLFLATVHEQGSLTEQFFLNAGHEAMDLRYVTIDAQTEYGSSMIFYGQDKKDKSNSDELLKQYLGDEILKDFISSLEDDSKEDANFSVENHDNSEKSRNKKEGKNSNDSFLAEFSRDLTKLARENKSDPVVGRDKEIHRVIQILSRRSKNNPVLTGEPGVGKTAIVEGLAQHIAGGNVPQDLLKKRILSLDLAAMVAGTKYRGEFEERMKRMMKELQEKKDIILFIDELHTIIGAGGPEGTMDASNIMKPALSRGEIQIIGATTTKEYTRHIEKDSALERRFQVVKVEEPSDAETEEILKGIKTKYEKYHHVIYEDNVIPSIVKLSRRYIPEKVLPDKAIDIMDEAGAYKKIQEEDRPTELIEIENSISQLIQEKQKLVSNQDYENAAVVRDKVRDLKSRLDSYSAQMKENGNVIKNVCVSDIEKIISEMTGIPLEQMTSSETLRIINMEKELHGTVIGQEDAVTLISGAIRRSRAGISSPKHPVGSFIFLGPTGVGKTQLAKALAKYLFGTEDALIRIDMSDFMEKHNASRLIGAPPGYVGYEEGGVLTEKVRRHPYSVVLLDEIEKAHPDIFNLLLQLLEEGELNDNLGHTVNFKNTVIIMTSNAGARQITSEGKVGFGLTDGVIPYEEIKAGALNELRKLLNPELINRIDDVIVFNALSKEEVSKILDIQLAELGERLKEKNLRIEVENAARNYLIEQGYNPSMGARPMKRTIRKEIEDPLSMQILENQDKDVDTVKVEFKKGKIKIHLAKTAEVMNVPIMAVQKL